MLDQVSIKLLRSSSRADVLLPSFIKRCFEAVGRAKSGFPAGDG